MLDWIHWFFGTSLLKLSVVQDAPSFWGPTANTKDGFVLSLLELVAPRCPNLQQVELPSYSSIGAKPSKMPLVSQLSHLLPALRVVSGNASFLAPQSLEALGQLPCLETLKINAQYGERSSIATGEIQWSERYFPTIRRLHLVAVRFETLQSLWNFEALVHALTTLEIETSSQGRSTALCIASRTSFIDFIRELSSRSPYIIDLDCRLHACRFFCSTCVPARLSFPELESLNALPLQRLSFQRIWLAENVSHSHFAHSVPQVRTLQLRDMTLTLKDLNHYVARLPRLEHIRCALSDPCLERKNTLIEDLTTERIAPQAITFDLKLPHLVPPEYPLHENQIISLARYLYRLCPRARCSSSESEFELVCRRINKLLLKYQ
ncbi:F-box-like domain protein [Rhizoctonia solani AG-3 Rhs1AP]|uniref:F-box-like domain protein n=1 Tax=Rhizoctonia solani AG-3 Rhs1AP TaxID=1086054 RepID=A0A0A1UJQ4_9AGAM|nr:F-box-like domain protein [Rhizoctonia solani AG-3 Rhs1AP]